jgi:tetratricopeptide (TPR) repeat protein
MNLLRRFLRRAAFAALVPAGAVLCGALPAPAPADSALRAGLDLYFRNELQAALPALQRALDQRPEDPDRHAWVAETLRRMGRKSEAVVEARRAAGLSPCHAFAHTVLADAMNPQYGEWEGSDPESTWAHLSRAVECDSTDPNTWVSVWTESIHRGDRGMERRAIRGLVHGGFLTPPLRAYTRWAMQSLPAGAVLLVNGDMDTYPALALQESEGFRTDVAVVNISLLNTPWYARMVRDRFNVDLPFTEAGLDSAAPYRDVDENLVLVADQIVRHWIGQVEAGEFPRPLAAAVTIPGLDFGAHLHPRFLLCGPYWRCQVGTAPAALDTAVAWRSLKDLEPGDFAGPATCERDRSPVRRGSTPYFLNNMLVVAVQCCSAWLDTGRKEDARAGLRWLEDFVGLAPRPEQHDRALQDIRRRLAEP